MELQQSKDAWRTGTFYSPELDITRSMVRNILARLFSPTIVETLANGKKNAYVKEMDAGRIKYAGHIKHYDSVKGIKEFFTYSKLNGFRRLLVIDNNVKTDEPYILIRTSEPNKAKPQYNDIRYALYHNIN